MPYSAVVLQLLLSAPGDLPDHHKSLIQRSIRVWNNDQSRFYGIFFSPTDWKEGGSPAFGEYAQQVLNEQIVDDSDAGIVVFTDRLGTPTPDHESGTAEEIHRLRTTGKEVGILVNKVHREPLSGDALKEKARLDAYIRNTSKQAFIGDYDSDHRLAEVVGTLLTRMASKYRRELDRSAPATTTELSETRVEVGDEYAEDVGRGVWPRIEVAESLDTDNRGQVRTNRDWRLVLESNIDQPVTDVEFRYEDGHGNPLRSFDLLGDRHERTEILPPRGKVSYPLYRAWQSPNSAVCVVTWTDHRGASRETRATVRTV